MKTKKFFKRALTLLLTLLMLLSTTSLGISAAQVELANTGANSVSGGYLYFDNTTTQWTDTYIYFCIGHSSYTSLYRMTKLNNTNYYYCKMDSWGGSTYYGVIGTSSSWGSGNWGSSNLQNANHYTAAYTSTYGLNSGSYYVFKPATSSNGTSLSISYKGTAASSMNATVKASVYAAATNSTTYSANAGAGIVTASGYYVSSESATSTRTEESSTSSTNYTSRTFAQTSTVKLVASANAGYEFKGWSTSESEADIVSTSETYSPTVGTSTTNYYALFKEVVSEHTVTFKDWNDNVLDTQTVQDDNTPTAPADPTRDGYTFTGWSDGTNTYTSANLPAITANTTFKAQYTLNTYTVTTSVLTGGGSASSDYDSVTHGSTVQLNATPDAANDYVFDGWEITGSYELISGDLETSTSVEIKVLSNITAKANFKQTPTFTINANVANNTGGSVNLTQEHKIGQGDSFEFIATPYAGYRFSHWTINGTYDVVEGNVNSATFKITPKQNLTATAHFVRIWTVTFVNMNGSKLAEISVDNGSTVPAASVPTPPTVEHYTFTDWSDGTNTYTSANLPAITANTTFKAQYTGKTYTVTVNTVANGTVHTTAISVVYPGEVTLTATPDAGYTLVNWGISGLSEEVSKDTNTITIIPKSNLTITPNFALGRKLTVYTYSANGYNNLTLTEDGSNNVISGEEQPLTQDFNGITWDKSNQTDISVNATELTAELSGTTTVDVTQPSNWYKDYKTYLVDSEYHTVVFRNNWKWTDVRIHIWNSSGNNGWPGEAMQKAGNDGTYDLYVFLIPKNSTGFIISGIKDDGSGARDQSPDMTTLPSANTAKAYEMGWSDGNNLNDYNLLGLSTYNSSLSASSGPISLNEQLFDGTTWLGREEVWVYQNGTDSEVTYRRDLLDLITQHTNSVATGNADEGYTSDSWAYYEAAYNDAKEASGKADATQAEINAAYAELVAKFEALVPQTSVTVTYTQNIAPSDAKIGSTSFITETGTVKVVQGKEVEVKFVAPYCYYIKSVMINGQPVEITGPDAWTYLATLTFTTDTTIDVVYEENPEIKVTENNATGGTISFGYYITNYEGKNLISYGYTSSFDVTAPNLYYIQSIYVDGQKVYEGTDETKVSIPNCPLNNVTADVNIIVTYDKCSTYKVTILPYSNVGGNLYYNNELISNTDGTVIEVLAGQSVTITAEPSTGYGVYYWVADTQSAHRESTYTFSDITNDHNLAIEWLKLQQLTVTVVSKPASVATSMANNSTTAITVDQYSAVTLTTTCTDTRYKFVSWTIEGAYYNADSSTKSDTTYKIVASGGNIKATANYEQVNRRVYMKDDAGWNLTDSTYVYCHDGSADVGEPWPGYKMQYDSKLGFYYADIPLEATHVIFNKSHNSDNSQVEYTNIKASDNLFTNKSDKTGYPITYVEDGYYLQGKWNGKEYAGYDLQKFENNGDGTYSITITVNSTTDGYIYVNPTDEGSLFWQPATTGSTANPVTLTGPSSAYIDFADRRTVKVEIDTANFAKAYDVTFTFNPSTGVFSWTKVENVPTITVIATDGRGKNEADENMNSANGRVGDTFFDDATVNSTSIHTYYTSAQVVAGTPVTFITQVNKNSATDGYDYYVAGWVINGTEFVSATSLGNGKYSGSYIFTQDDSTVVPVYFHTNEWLTSNGVSTVTVYAVADKGIENWNKYFAAYTWYKVGGNTVYAQFGPWSGQLMIPVTGLDGVYYTYVETSTSDKVQISGITFSNYSKNNGSYDTSIDTNYDNIQTYDYYEFISLLEDGKQNITFVIKDTNDNYNRTDVKEGTVTLQGEWDFVQYTDYSGLKIDIFGNNIESIDATLNDTDALYVIQAGDKNVTNDTLDGQWYVECYLYNATGEYLGKCFSYELHDEDSDIWTTLSAYVNQRAYISYEHVNGSRYDGEWYGDANVSVTINLAVKVALMGDDDKYTIDTEGDLNKAIYGEAFINNAQNVDVVRGDTVSLTAMPLTGYKFVGWYTAEGKLFDTNLASAVTAAIGTHYVAVFEPLAEGSFYVNHYIYTGNGTASYRPPAHNGNAQLYVGIQNVTQGTTTSLLLGNSAGLAATEGDRLLITIATDGIGADKFYAWYTDAVDKFGDTTYEEVGVDSEDNLAFSVPDSQYYMNVSTVEGSIDRVYFQFWYTVGADDDFVLNFYSDLMPVSDKITLVYQYTDRYGNPKSYYVKYQLNDDEIKGFAGNNFTEFTPAYISSNDNSWVNTILANAPYVEDYFKDTTWKINSSMYNTMTFLLWATQPETMYTVTTIVNKEDGAEVIVNQVPYNTVIDLDIRELVPDASYTGYWYQDVNNNGSYDKTVDIILTYGPYYGYRVTQDMTLNYQFVDSDEDYKFNVSLDAPVYGREQTTDSEGNNHTDIVIIDYVVNILTPYFYYNHPEFTPIYGDQVITDGSWNKTLVTVDSLRAAGYTVSYGVLLQQVGTFKIDKNYNGKFEDAEAAAKLKGYGTATDDAPLIDFLATGAEKGYIGNTGTYGYVYDATDHNITNKNRVLFVLEQNNSDGNRNRFYNVYGYLTVTYNGETTTYISNVQTLNIYDAGTTDAVVENNTSFA